MADNDAPKKPRGRPKKKKCGKKEAQNVPGKNLQKSQKERGRKRKNYLATKGLCIPDNCHFFYTDNIFGAKKFTPKCV